MSSRLWTSGYNFIHPKMGVVGHEYGSKDKSNSNNNNGGNEETSSSTFWENEMEQSLGQIGLYHPLQSMVLQRIKFLLNYPESGRDMIKPNNLLLHTEKYGLGVVRTLKSYMEFAGLDVMSKKSSSQWCKVGSILQQ